jgi:microcystin-dependent protein
MSVGNLTTEADLRRFIEDVMQEPGAVDYKVVSGRPTIPDAVPTGSVFPTALSAAPDGYLLCDGSAVSRTTYAALFAAIGTTYGTGDGSTTFNVPDLIGRVVAGVDALATRLPSAGTPAATSGAATHTLTVAELPAHDHGISADQVSNTPTTGGANRLTNLANALTGNHDRVSDVTGGDDPHNNVQPTMALHYLIKT